MKAAVVTSPGKIVIQDTPEPETGSYDALVEILAVSVCSGTDYNVVNNKPYHKVTYPTVLGHEGIGRVIKTGEKVRNLKVGDLVARPFQNLPETSGLSSHWGAFAERGYVRDWQALHDDGVPHEEWAPFTVHQTLPADFDPIASTLIITWRETFSFLTQTGIDKLAGAEMLIIGSGANARAFADHARNLGISAHVVGSAARKQEFETAGIHSYTDHRSPDLLTELTKAGIEKIDIIIDAVGNEETTRTLLPLLRSGGTVGLYGLEEGYTLAPQLGENFTFYYGTTYDEGSAHEAIVAYVKDGKLNAWDYLSKNHIYPLEKISEALTAAHERKVLKAVVKMNQ